MTLVKATIKSQNRVYVSISIPGHGSNDDTFEVGKVGAQLVQANFPSFQGTAEEWDEMMDVTTEIKIEKIGNT